MISFLEKQLMKMPTEAQMDKDILFQKLFLSKPLKTPEKTKPFFWILYQAGRWTFFVSLALAIFVIIRLFRLTDLSQQAVIQQLKIFSLSASIPCWLAIVPYYVKAKKVVGFDGIDYTDTIMIDDRKKLPKKQLKSRLKVLILMCFFMIPTSYWVIRDVLIYYNSLIDLEWVILGILVYGGVIFPMSVCLLIHYLLISKQFKILDI